MTMQNREVERSTTQGSSPAEQPGQSQSASRETPSAQPEQRSVTRSPSGAIREGSLGGRRGYGSGPFSLMRRLSDDMDRLFGDFFGPRLFDWGERDELGWPRIETSSWPEIEISQQGNKLVVQADIPGLKKDDVTVELRDNELCISGERREEKQTNEQGYFRSERTYGSFCRTVPLPEGAKPDTATATFENGVLKVEIEAPGVEQSRGRRIEVH